MLHNLSISIKRVGWSEHNIMSSAADKKRVLREFEWFEVQTKVRQIISEVLEPLEKKAHNNSAAITRLQDRSSRQEVKVRDLEKMVSNDPGVFESGVFLRVEEKFQEQRIQTLQLEQRVQELQTFIDAKASLLNERVAQVGGQLEKIGEMRAFVKNEVENQKNTLIESQKNLADNFDRINSQIADLQVEVETLKGRQQRVEKKASETETHMDQQLVKVRQHLSECQEILAAMDRTLETALGRVEMVEEEVGRSKRMEKKLSKLDQYIRDQQSIFSNLQYKIEVIQPMVTLTLINEYNMNVLPPPLRRNVDVFFYSRYHQLVTDILDNKFDPKQARHSAKKHKELMKEIHTRATKLVFRLKKDKLRAQGLDIDLISHQKKEAALQQTQIPIEFSNWGQPETVQVKRNSVVTEEVEALNENIRHEYDLFKDEMRAELRDSKEFNQNMEFVFKKHIQKLEQNHAALNKDYEDHKVSLTLQNKALSDRQRQIRRCLIGVGDWQQKVQIALEKTLASVMVLSEIERQDEHDRKHMMLLGVKQKHMDPVIGETLKKKKPLYQLDKECLSCTGNPNYYNEFFKMACLNYNSSPVRLQGRSCPRLEAIEKIQQQLIGLNKDLDDKDKQAPSTQKPETAKPIPRYESAVLEPSRDTRSASQKFHERASQQIKITSSQEMQPKSPDSPKARILDPRQLTSSLLSRTHNRLFSRKLEQSLSRRKGNSSSVRQRSGHMIHVSDYFRQLKKQNSDFLHD